MNKSVIVRDANIVNAGIFKESKIDTHLISVDECGDESNDKRNPYHNPQRKINMTELTPQDIALVRAEYSDLDSASIAYVTRKGELEALEAQIKARTSVLELEMEVIKDDILYEMEKQKLPKVTTSIGSISRSTKDTPFVKPDQWNDVHKYILETGRFDLLQKRLTTTVATAILLGDADLGIAPQVIPGVGLTRVSSIRITRSKK